MIKTDFSLELRKLLLESRESMADIAAKTPNVRTGWPVTPRNVSAALGRYDGESLSAAQVRIAESAGYDIELKFVKRRKPPTLPKKPDRGRGERE